MSNRVVVAGVGMLPFVKPGAAAPYNEMGADAVRLALRDAGLSYEAVEQAYVGWVYGDSTAGQAALYKVGLSGIPVVNVNNNCSTGSSALFLARQAVESGMDRETRAIRLDGIFEQDVELALVPHDARILGQRRSLHMRQRLAVSGKGPVLVQRHAHCDDVRVGQLPAVLEDFEIFEQRHLCCGAQRTIGAGQVHQRDVPGVQIAHRGHEAQRQVAAQAQAGGAEIGGCL